MKVFFIVLCLVAVSVRAEILRSDLVLLNSAPKMDDEEYVDPYWDLAWHIKVASYGDPDSQFFLGQIYEQGKLVPKNMKKAMAYYEKAGAQSHLEACMHLGKYYEDRDFQRSVFWYHLAAEKDYTPALLSLSAMHERAEQYDVAIFWQEKAVRQMFPKVVDLTNVSPDLDRLYIKAGKK